jgi:hypothetical protein
MYSSLHIPPLPYFFFLCSTGNSDSFGALVGQVPFCALCVSDWSTGQVNYFCEAPRAANSARNPDGDVISVAP